MKKYVKPDLYYENFELSQHVATCAWDMSNSKSVLECSATSDGSTGAKGVTIFIDNNNCGSLTKADVEYFCYTASTEGVNVFNS